MIPESEILKGRQAPAPLQIVQRTVQVFSNIRGRFRPRSLTNPPQWGILHPVFTCGSKAVWFHSLGYTRDEWQVLTDDLMAIARNCAEFGTETTQFGIKYKAAGSVGRPNHRPGNVLTVWIVEDDDPPRLVTAYPDEDK